MGVNRSRAWQAGDGKEARTSRIGHDRHHVGAQANDAVNQVRRRRIGTRPEPIKQFVRMVEPHWDGIVAWLLARLDSPLREGANSLIQVAKCRARENHSKRTWSP